MLLNSFIYLLTLLSSLRCLAADKSGDHCGPAWSEFWKLWDTEENNGKNLTLKYCYVVPEHVENPGFVKEEAWERG